MLRKMNQRMKKAGSTLKHSEGRLVPNMGLLTTCVEECG